MRARTPNLKSVALALTELLTFNSPILRGHVTLATPLFTIFWHSGADGCQWRRFNYEPQTTPEKKCLNTPIIENGLCRL